MALALIFLSSFLWFILHAVPSLYFGDNGELLTAVHVGGLPHPSGFPLFLLLGATPAKAGTFAVNMTSSAAGAAAVALSFALARRLFGRTSAFFAIAVLLGSCTLTLHSAMARVYSYQLACMLSVMLAAVFFKPEKRWGLLFGFLLGLSACTHTLFIGGIVFAGVYLSNRRSEIFSLTPWMMAGMAVGVSLYFWIPLRAHLKPPLVWGDPSHIGSFWNYLTLKAYSEIKFVRDLSGIWLYVQQLFRVMSTEWNPLAWVLGITGVILHASSQRRKISALLAVMAFNVLQLGLFGNDSVLYAAYRYFLPFVACSALLAGLGADALWNRWAGKQRASSLARGMIGMAFLGIFIVFPGWKWSDLSRSDASYRHLCSMFRTIPRGSTVYVETDTHVFAATYGVTAKGWRPDLTFHDPSALAYEVPRQGGSLYTTALHRVPEPYVCRPWGLLFRIYHPGLEKNPPPPPPLFWMPPHFTHAEMNDGESRELLANLFYMEAHGRADQGDQAGAFKALEQSAQSAPRVAPALLKAAILYDEWGDSSNAERYYLKAEALQPHTFNILLNLGIHYGKTGQWGPCREYLNRALKIKPGDPTVQRYMELLEQQSR